MKTQDHRGVWLFALRRTLEAFFWNPAQTLKVSLRRILFVFTKRFCGGPLMTDEGIWVHDVQSLLSFCSIVMFRELDGPWNDGFMSLEKPTVFDIGSNLGIFSAYVRDLNKGAFIVSADPWDDMLNPHSTVHFQVAVGTAPRVLFSIADSEGRTGSTAPFWANSRESYEVDQRSLDYLWDRSGKPEVDVLKIDVDGAECDVVDSGAECLKHVRWLIAEINSPKAADHFCAKFGEPALKVFDNWHWNLKRPATKSLCYGCAQGDRAAFYKLIHSPDGRYLCEKCQSPFTVKFHAKAAV